MSILTRASLCAMNNAAVKYKKKVKIKLGAVPIRSQV